MAATLADRLVHRAGSTARSSNGTRLTPGLRRPRRAPRRCLVAPPTGQVHSPSTCDQPDAGGLQPAQDLLGLLGGRRGRRARGRASTVSARGPQLARPTAPACGAGRDHPGGGEPAVADDVHRPPAVVLAAGGDHLGAPGQRAQPLGAGGAAQERGEPVAEASRRPRSARRRPARPSGAEIASTTASGRRSRAVAQLVDDRGVGLGASTLPSQGERQRPISASAQALSDGALGIRPLHCRIGNASCRAATRPLGGLAWSRTGRGSRRRRRAPAAPATAAATARR